MKRLVFILIVVSNVCIGQVGIGTINPKGALDIESDNLGLVLPRVTSLEDVTNNNSGLAEDGTIVYDVSRNKTCFRIADSWICIANDASVVVTNITPAPIAGKLSTEAPDTSDNADRNIDKLKKTKHQ